MAASTRAPVEPTIIEGRLAGRGSSTASRVRWKRPSNVTRSPSRSRRTISKPSSKRDARWSNGIPNASNSVRFHPAPRADDETPAAQLVHGRRRLGQDRRVVEVQARDEGAKGDPLGDRREAGEQGPRFPRPSLRPAVVPIEVVVADPDRVEADLLGSARHRRVLGPPDLALHLRELDADAQTLCHARESRDVRGGGPGPVRDFKGPLLASAPGWSSASHSTPTASLNHRPRLASCSSAS